jgi:hypothetical protein
MMVSINRPTSVVVSHHASPRLVKPQPKLSEIVKDVVEIAAAARQPIELDHHDSVAWAEHSHELLKLRPFRAVAPGGFLAEDPLASGGLEGFALPPHGPAFLTTLVHSHIASNLLHFERNFRNGRAWRSESYCHPT